ncbi:hypothetical protein CI102_12109 [Trichoderma harzianum]|nr:hypothetical protein CI102_12109 [Trichoderma harzianum]
MPSESCIAGLRFAGCGYEYNLTNASPSHSFDHGPLLAPRPLRGKYRLRGNHEREPRQSLTVPPPRKKKKTKYPFPAPSLRVSRRFPAAHKSLREQKVPNSLPFSDAS